MTLNISFSYSLHQRTLQQINLHNRFGNCFMMDALPAQHGLEPVYKIHSMHYVQNDGTLPLSYKVPQKNQDM